MAACPVGVGLRIKLYAVGPLNECQTENSLTLATARDGILELVQSGSNYSYIQPLLTWVIFEISALKVE